MKKKISITAAIGLLSILLSNNAMASTNNIKAGLVDTDGFNLNVRSSPSTNSTIKAKLKDDSYVTILNESGNWYYVEYKDNNYGYVHRDYIDILSTNTIKINGIEVTDNNFEIDLGTSILSEMPINLISTVEGTSINFSNLKYKIEYYDDITSGIVANSTNTILNNVINNRNILANTADDNKNMEHRVDVVNLFTY